MACHSLKRLTLPNAQGHDQECEQQICTLCKLSDVPALASASWLPLVPCVLSYACASCSQLAFTGTQSTRQLLLTLCLLGAECFLLRIVVGVGLAAAQRRRDLVVGVGALHRNRFRLGLQ